ncbi:MAG TPA: hypothetical protein VL524_16755 [Gemmatimonadaceae bacterium]|jgi:hypothetical protein|nr:hypothetical protein [Gemmatimonadaceae bacterium]
MLRHLLLAAAFAGPVVLRAQTIAGAVLAAREPHHHLAYEDSTLRVLRVRVPPHDSTLLHEHDADYFWIALGASEFVNARLGVPDAVARSADLAIHYAPAKFAHVARNTGATPFDNITVELLGAQSGVRNLCDEALTGKAVDCVPPAARSGVSEHPAFATDQLRVSLVSIAPGADLQLPGTMTNAWVIALDTADAAHALAIEGAGRWLGGTFRAAGGRWAIRNRGNRLSRVLLVVPLGP